MKKHGIEIAIKIIIIYFIINCLAQITIKDYKKQICDVTSYTSTDVYDALSPENAEHFEGAYLRMLDKGDRAIVKMKLPQESYIDNATIGFFVYNSIINVYYNDKNIYSYGQDIYEAGHMIGAAYAFVNIPDEAWGDELTVVLDITENSAFSKLQKIWVMPSNISYVYYLVDHAVDYYVFFTIFVVSLIAILFLVMNGKFTQEFRKAFYIALFIFSISAWIMSNYGMFNIICKNSYLLAQVEYIALFFCPIPILLYMYELENVMVSKNIIRVAIIENAVFVTIAVILNFTTLLHFSKTTTMFHIIAFMDIIIMIWFAWSGVRRRKSTENLPLYGIITMFVFTAMDLIKFYLVPYINIPFGVQSSTFSPMGVLVFIVALVVSYLSQIASDYVNDAEKRQLLKLAHTDVMTGMLNRAACDEKLQDMRRRDVKDYAIVFMDLNGLKTTNDNLGHDIGDELIEIFADSVKKVIGQAGWCGRMGGDEFIIAFEGESSKDVNIYLTELSDRINYINKHEKNLFKVSFASGIVISSEKDYYEIADALELADQRMYENKRNMKK